MEPVAKLACPGKTDDFEAETFRYDETYPGRVGEERRDVSHAQHGDLPQKGGFILSSGER